MPVACMGNHVLSLLQAEGDGQHNPYWDCVSSDFTHAPLGHLTDDADGFTIQALITRTANDPHVAHLAVGVHNETAQNATLNAVLGGMIGILARLVDEVDESSLTTGKLWLDVNILKLIDFDVRMLGCWIDGGHMTHLCYHW